MITFNNWTQIDLQELPVKISKELKTVLKLFNFATKRFDLLFFCLVRVKKMFYLVVQIGAFIRL